MEGYDPFELAKIVRTFVARINKGVEERKYYRFRASRWYGGIATGDVVGCNLRCKFCWGWRYTHNTDKGYFYSPNNVAEKIIEIALSKGYKYVRLSGGEPTLTVNHLFSILDRVEETQLTFVLETNGLIIGYDENIAKKLARYTNIIVRVSFKGTTCSEFHELTNAYHQFFEYQFKALENLLNSGMKPGKDFYPAVMLSFTTNENYTVFKKRLSQIHPHLLQFIDEEYVIFYPHVVEMLNKHKLKPRIAYKPNNIPEFMV